MCFACEQEQMLAAYREYVAQRKAALAPAPGEKRAPAGAELTPDDGAWAAGTWFEAKIAEKE